MTSDTKTVLNLKEPIKNIDGSVLKDAGQENRSQDELSKLTKSQILDSYPAFTVGSAILRLINAKTNSESIEEIAKLSRLLAKINNKMLTDKGEWHIEKQELLDLQEVFQKADPKTLNVNMHGQVYNRIQDLLIQATA